MKLNFERLLDEDYLSPAQQRAVRRQIHSKSIEVKPLTYGSGDCLTFNYSIEDCKKRESRKYSLKFQNLEELRSGIYKEILIDLIKTKISYLRNDQDKTTAKLMMNDLFKEDKRSINYTEYHMFNVFDTLVLKSASCYNAQSLFKTVEFINQNSKFRPPYQFYVPQFETLLKFSKTMPIR